MLLLQCLRISDRHVSSITISFFIRKENACCQKCRRATRKNVPCIAMNARETHNHILTNIEMLRWRTLESDPCGLCTVLCNDIVESVQFQGVGTQPPLHQTERD